MKSDADESETFRPEDIDAALRRAALRAREIAEQTNTPLWIMRDGKIIDLMQETRSEDSSSTTNDARE